MGLANLCGTGGGPLCSIYRGKGDEEEAENVMGNSFTLLLLLGAAATAFFLVLKRPILYLFGASDDTFPYADDYMTIYLCGTLFVMIGLGMNPFINAQGFGKTGMFTVVIGAVINIAVSYTHLDVYKRQYCFYGWYCDCICKLPVIEANSSFNCGVFDKLNQQSYYFDADYQCVPSICGMLDG